MNTNTSPILVTVMIGAKLPGEKAALFLWRMACCKCHRRDDYRDVL